MKRLLLSRSRLWAGIRGKGSPLRLGARVSLIQERRHTRSQTKTSRALWYSAGAEVVSLEGAAVLHAPPEFRDAEACLPKDLCRQSIQLPRPAPLIPEARLGLVLRRLLLVTVEGRALDDERLIARLSRLLPLARVPRKPRQRWPARLQVLWDQANPLGPVREDQARVVDRLRRWRSPRELEVITVNDRGEFTWHHRQRGLRRWIKEDRPVRAADASTTCLALSELGCASTDPARKAGWLRLRCRLERARARCVALVPYPETRWDPWITRPWQAVEWEEARTLTRPSSSQGTRLKVRSQGPAGAQEGKALDDLRRALAPAVHVDRALLRAMRLAIGRGAPAVGQGALAVGRGALDVGAESDVWLDEARIAERSGLGFSWAPEQRQALLGELAAPDCAWLRELSVGVLHRLRAGEGLLGRAEELFATGDEAARVEALGLFRRYIKRRMAERGFADPFEAAYLLRLESRLGEGDFEHQELAALWALRHRDGQGFDAEPPPGLDVSRVLWLLEGLPPPRTYWLEEFGEALRVRRVDAGVPGALPLLSLSLRWPRLEVEALAGDALLGSATLELGEAALLSESGLEQARAATRQPGRLLGRAATRWRLRGDYGLVRAELEQVRLPDRASSLRRDSDGLWVGMELRVFDWVPGEAAGRAAVVTIDHSVRETWLPWGAWPPPWASRLERHRYGLVATLPLSDRVATRLRWIPPGRYLMGSPHDENGRFGDEGPQHWVTLSRGFWLGEAPCTQEEWEAVMGGNPSYFKDKAEPSRTARRPVESVSWEDCQGFCARLNERYPGMGARLPTEAEWEYACRAGTASAYNDGSACTEPYGKHPAVMELGWFIENSRRETHDVKGLAPNAWDLYDLLGNVWEWCRDWYGPYSEEEQRDPLGPAQGQARVIRGGGWESTAGLCRSAQRSRYAPSGRYYDQGFRLLAGQPGEPGKPSRSSRPGAEAQGEPSSNGLAERSGAERQERGPASRGCGGHP